MLEKNKVYHPVSVASPRGDGGFRARTCLRLSESEQMQQESLGVPMEPSILLARGNFRALSCYS